MTCAKNYTPFTKAKHHLWFAEKVQTDTLLKILAVISFNKVLWMAYVIKQVYFSVHLCIFWMEESKKNKQTKNR